MIPGTLGLASDTHDVGQHRCDGDSLDVPASGRKHLFSEAHLLQPPFPRLGRRHLRRSMYDGTCLGQLSYGRLGSKLWGRGAVGVSRKSS